MFALKIQHVFLFPDKLREHFKGSGGSQGTSKASVSIQYEYDARRGKILDLNVTAGTRNDATDARETKLKINKGDLVIRTSVILISLY